MHVSFSSVAIALSVISLNTFVSADWYAWSQCGGVGYYGDRSCPKEHSCQKLNWGYWQCVEKGCEPRPEYITGSNPHAPPTREPASQISSTTTITEHTTQTSLVLSFLRPTLTFSKPTSIYTNSESLLPTFRYSTSATSEMLSTVTETVRSTKSVISTFTSTAHTSPPSLLSSSTSTSGTQSTVTETVHSTKNAVSINTSIALTSTSSLSSSTSTPAAQSTITETVKSTKSVISTAISTHLTSSASSLSSSTTTSVTLSTVTDTVQSTESTSVVRTSTSTALTSGYSTTSVIESLSATSSSAQSATTVTSDSTITATVQSTTSTVSTSKTKESPHQPSFTAAASSQVISYAGIRGQKQSSRSSAAVSEPATYPEAASNNLSVRKFEAIPRAVENAAAFEPVVIMGTYSTTSTTSMHSSSSSHSSSTSTARKKTDSSLSSSPTSVNRATIKSTESAIQTDVSTSTQSPTSAVTLQYESSTLSVFHSTPASKTATGLTSIKTSPLSTKVAKSTSPAQTYIFVSTSSVSYSIAISIFKSPASVTNTVTSIKTSTKNTSLRSSTTGASSNTGSIQTSSAGHSTVVATVKSSASVANTLTNIKTSTKSSSLSSAVMSKTPTSKSSTATAFIHTVTNSLRSTVSMTNTLTTIKTSVKTTKNSISIPPTTLITTICTSPTHSAFVSTVTNTAKSIASVTNTFTTIKTSVKTSTPSPSISGGAGKTLSRSLTLSTTKLTATLQSTVSTTSTIVSTKTGAKLSSSTAQSKATSSTAVSTITATVRSTIRSTNTVVSTKVSHHLSSTTSSKSILVTVYSTQQTTTTKKATSQVTRYPNSSNIQTSTYKASSRTTLATSKGAATSSYQSSPSIGGTYDDQGGPAYNAKSFDNDYTPIVGIEGCEYRLPIGELQTNYPDVFNMYILALEDLMNIDETRELSYYEICGIHGRPYIPWERPTPPGGDPQLGYCTHSSVLFTTWHRPYLLLLEQELYAHAIRIASTFTGPKASRYQAAAKKVRMPYWDWSSTDTMSKVPAVVMQTSLLVTKPGIGGGPVTSKIANPLYAYTFKNNQFRATFFADTWLEAAVTTLRRPTSLTQSNNAQVSKIMFNTYSSRRENTFNLFSIGSFDGFSSDVYQVAQTPVDWTSIESIHNDIHTIIGGEQGHMTYIDFSSFDPIFWLHHCNVDRLTAMYQAVKPDNKVEPFPRKSATFNFPNGGGIEDINTPLYPFRHVDGSDWTSKDVSTADSIHYYGYSYPEVPEGLPAANLTAFTAQKIQDLYGPNTQSNSFKPVVVVVAPVDNGTSTNANVTTKIIPISSAAASSLYLSIASAEASLGTTTAVTATTLAPGYTTSALPPPVSSSTSYPILNPEPAILPLLSAALPSSTITPDIEVAKNTSITTVQPASQRQEWITHVYFDASQINSTFTVWLTLNNQSSLSVPDFLVDSETIGGCSSLSTLDKKPGMTQITGTVPLTQALEARDIQLTSMDTADYLRANLGWRIIQGNNYIPLEQLPSLKVGVSSANVTYFDDSQQLPSVGNWSTFTQVTETKQGGLTSQQQSIVQAASAPALALNGTATNGSTLAYNSAA